MARANNLNQQQDLRRNLNLQLPPLHQQQHQQMHQQHQQLQQQHQQQQRQQHHDRHDNGIARHGAIGGSMTASRSLNTLRNLGLPTQLQRLQSNSLDCAGKLQISPELKFDFSAEDLVDEGEIGRGAYGTVNQVRYKQSNIVMAVKRIRSTVDNEGQKKLLMDLDVVMKSSDCPYIVQFYGALFKEGDCWICMELMSISLDKFYKFVHFTLQEMIPEAVLGKLTVAMLKALIYLKEKLKIIHRDIKPSNILLDHTGAIKLCDFGISGQLVDSIAKTQDAGCRPYMAPERIDPTRSSKGYDIRSDVWSLGITLYEVSTGVYPYPNWRTLFEQLSRVLDEPSPQLSGDDARFSPAFISFVNVCLIKDYSQRPKYNQLIREPFIMRYEEAPVDVAGYIGCVLERMPNDRSLLESNYL
ncbi:hypothetical protein HELRODRAFT_101835 [Helobdella robusta]|uniref:mitogen-activated protein kinase kinase n=1 Tax=Helobdella robusta TaxID=6412 RepID=T1ED72_HELRO|nr:hypothetical protein HELRODRAFT_101835 [Helobdella robusta]ESN98030.1 hypothetical protein HELRODRAFT_101835 [Helobdella robusta]